MRAHAQTMWKSVEVVRLSLVYASCSVTTQSWTILNFPLLVPISSWSQFQLVTCFQFQLVVILYELIVTFPCSHFVHNFAPRKQRHLRCCIYTMSSSHPPKIILPTPSSKLMNLRKSGSSPPFFGIVNTSLSESN